MSKQITQLSVSLKTINDIFVYAKEIIKSIERSPDSDPICQIKVNNDVNNNKSLQEPKKCNFRIKSCNYFFRIIKRRTKESKK